MFCRSGISPPPLGRQHRRETLPQLSSLHADSLRDAHRGICNVLQKRKIFRCDLSKFPFVFSSEIVLIFQCEFRRIQDPTRALGSTYSGSSKTHNITFYTAGFSGATTANKKCMYMLCEDTLLLFSESHTH